VKFTKQEELLYRKALFRIDYCLSEEEVTFERSVETLSTVLSLTGGLLGIITPLVNLLIAWLQRHLFLSNLIERVFHHTDSKTHSPSAYLSSLSRFRFYFI
jgi:hypothetical protein